MISPALFFVFSISTLSHANFRGCDLAVSRWQRPNLFSRREDFRRFFVIFSQLLVAPIVRSAEMVLSPRIRFPSLLLPPLCPKSTLGDYSFFFLSGSFRNLEALAHHNPARPKPPSISHPNLNPPHHHNKTPLPPLPAFAFTRALPTPSPALFSLWCCPPFLEIALRCPLPPRSLHRISTARVAGFDGMGILRYFAEFLDRLFSLPVLAADAGR